MPLVFVVAAGAGRWMSQAFRGDNPPGGKEVIMHEGDVRNANTESSVGAAHTMGFLGRTPRLWRLAAVGLVPIILSSVWIFEREFGGKVVKSGSQAGGSEIGYIDGVGDPPGVPTVVSGKSVQVFGWAADTIRGAPVTKVTVYVDGAAVGDAALGGMRSDVVAHYNRNDYADSAWSLAFSSSAFSIGSHMVTVTAVGPSGSGNIPGSRPFTVVK